jgi:integrase family protein
MKKSKGSIFKNSKGKWIAKMTHNGKTKKREASTKKDAERKLAEIKEEFSRLDRVTTNEIALKNSPERLSTKDVFEEYINFKKYGRGQIAPTSIQRLISTVTNHIYPSYEWVNFLSLRSKDINELIDLKYEEGLSYSTIKKIYDAFSGCCKYAINEMKIMLPHESPMLGAKLLPKIRFNYGEVHYYSEQERLAIKQEALRRTSTGRLVYRYGPVLVFLLNTGLRAGEVCALSRSDIEHGNKTFINVRKTVITIMEEGKWITKIQNHPKTDKSNRKIPLNTEAKGMMNLLFSEVSKHSELMVSTSNGELVTPSALNKTLARVLRAANVKKQGGVHTLRDSFATVLFDKGMNVQIVSALLGHSSSTVTENHYIKILDDYKMRAVEILDAI